MGSDTYAYLISDDDTVTVMRFDSADPIVTNKEIPITINMENTYLFDALTEECISFPEKTPNQQNIKLLNKDLDEKSQLEDKGVNSKKEILETNNY